MQANPLSARLDQVDFLETPIEDAIEFLRSRSVELDPMGRGVNFILDSRVERGRDVTLQLSDVTIGVAMICLAEQVGLDYRKDAHAFLILPAGEGELAKQARQPRTQSVSSPQAARARDLMLDRIEFTDAPLRDVLQFVSEKSREGRAVGTGINLVVSHRVDPEIPVSLRLNKVPASMVLGQIASFTGIEFRIEPWAIMIEPPGTKMLLAARLKRERQEEYAKLRKQMKNAPKRKYDIGDIPKDPRSPAHPDYVHSTAADIRTRTNALNNVYKWKNGKWTFVRYGSGDKNKPTLDENGRRLVTGSLGERR